MIPLTNLDSLRLVSSSSATLDVVAIFEGADSGNTKQLTKISTATTTTIVNAPRQEREVNHVFVRNTHASTSVDITFQILMAPTPTRCTKQQCWQDNASSGTRMVLRYTTP